MGKVLIIDGDKCTGCRVCELICSLHHQGECNPRRSYLRVLQNMEFDVNIPVRSAACDLCGECVKWCLPQALSLVSHGDAAVLRKKNAIGIFPAPLVGGALPYFEKGGQK